MTPPGLEPEACARTLANRPLGRPKSRREAIPRSNTVTVGRLNFFYDRNQRPAQQQQQKEFDNSNQTNLKCQNENYTRI
ncbi:hypothetical protein CDAR_235991 [Caerostris darwini]|uniref:Uncharacterized protein n=1 Tax=Caerostris darwini TaxID=1538125 RepID=A0AAV4UG58_9ARAC|nr:hypothetical protein CDAR_235991 [Caerostris darwini]